MLQFFEKKQKLRAINSYYIFLLETKNNELQKDRIVCLFVLYKNNRTVKKPQLNYCNADFDGTYLTEKHGISVHIFCDIMRYK